MVYFFQNSFRSHLELDCENLGFLRGYSAFEYLRTYNRAPFCLKAHLLRFLFSLQKMHLKCPYSLEELETITYQLIEQHEGECGIKWYGYGSKSPDGLRHNGECEVFAFTQKITTPPKHYYTEGIKTGSLFEKRPLPEAKTTAYFAACRELSEKKELQEVLYLNEKQEFLEAATSNLFFIKNKSIYTSNIGVLYGITREVVLELARPYCPIIYDNISYKELPECNEIFITATNKEIMPVSSIDGFFFEVGHIMQHLMSLFSEYIHTDSNKDYIPDCYQKEVLLKT